MKQKPIKKSTLREKRSVWRLPLLSFLVVLAISCKKHDLPGCEGEKGLNQIGHVVVIYLENCSFDNLYGQFPGANGFSTATFAKQVDSFGNIYDTLPPIPADTLHYFPTDLANEPFSIEKYLRANMATPDLV